jgi:hypothetical protein
LVAPVGNPRRRWEQKSRKWRRRRKHETGYSRHDVLQTTQSVGQRVGNSSTTQAGLSCRAKRHVCSKLRRRNPVHTGSTNHLSLTDTKRRTHVFAGEVSAVRISPHSHQTTGGIEPESGFGHFLPNPFEFSNDLTIRLS